jgi:hypothetical protein
MKLVLLTDESVFFVRPDEDPLMTSPNTRSFCHTRPRSVWQRARVNRMAAQRGDSNTPAAEAGILLGNR